MALLWLGHRDHTSATATDGHGPPRTTVPPIGPAPIALTIAALVGGVVLAAVTGVDRSDTRPGDLQPAAAFPASPDQAPAPPPSIAGSGATAHPSPSPSPGAGCGVPGQSPG